MKEIGNGPHGMTVEQHSLTEWEVSVRDEDLNISVKMGKCHECSYGEAVHNCPSTWRCMQGIMAGPLGWQDGCSFLSSVKFGTRSMCATRVAEVEPVVEEHPAPVGDGITDDYAAIQNIKGKDWRPEVGEEVRLVNLVDTISSPHCKNGMVGTVKHDDNGSSVPIFVEFSQHKGSPVGAWCNPAHLEPVSTKAEAKTEEEAWKRIKVGSRVRLGRHKMESYGNNWSPEMDQYVGREAVIKELLGVDLSNCPIGKVDIDNRTGYWRLESMELLEE